MKVFREIICMVAIAAVMIIILALVFYDYLADGNEVPEESSYTSSKEVKEALTEKEKLDKEEESAVIGTFSKAAYNIDEADINQYVSEGLLTQGKVNPFDELKEDNSGGTTGNSGSSNNSTNDKNSNSTKEKSDSQGTFFEKAGTK